uniref:Late transcription factor 3-like protein n=1 Tax=Mimivirus LCMiAC01 TaxID=2506608 RepID=A0A481Z089_9VIRU|nr:MAG: late transcription factor 3-like protein [Mimivirus LCMiAC01]
MTQTDIKRILKKLGQTKYYEHRAHILSKFNGLPPPTINRETEEKLRDMFKQIQLPFQKHKPSTRKNFLSYSFVLHKFFQLLELDDLVACFQLLKSREKLRQQDAIWKNICKELDWQFIPSI